MKNYIAKLRVSWKNRALSLLSVLETIAGRKKIFSSQKFALSESGLVFILLPAHHILAQAKLDL